MELQGLPRTARILAVGAAIVLWMPAAAADPVSLAFERTEIRETCDHYTPTKQVFFGETHLHTAYSMDAVNIDTRVLPADAYAYAKGERAVGIPPWADTRKNFAEPGACAPSNDEPSKVSQFPYGMPGDRCQYTASRTAQKLPARALDFAALTDHAEQFGEANICYFESYESCEDDGDCDIAGQYCDSGQCVPLGWDSDPCVLARDELSRLRTGLMPGIIAVTENAAANPVRLTAICNPEGADLLPVGFQGANCELNAVRVWDQIQVDAEEAYDRSSVCEFTSFIGYEYTAMANNGRCSADGYACWADVDCNGDQTCETPSVPGGMDNLHRNIIFRNASVIDSPISNVEQPSGCGQGIQCLPKNQGVVGSPVNMLKLLAEECNPESSLHPDCEFVSIPHNPNLSGGTQFQPLQAFDDDVISPAQKQEEAEVRNAYEPLVEIMQIKGGSECRYQPSNGQWWGIGITDEYDPLCDFENMNFSRLGGNYLDDLSPDNLSQSLPPRSYVRNVLSLGMQYSAANTGQPNPFKLGFVGALDNHSGTPGQTNEEEYARIGAHGVNSWAVAAQALNETNFLGFETSPGGLTAAWAEENSRDSIFNALQSRETYATSGTRPSVRFFGGFDLPVKMCRRGDFAAEGYENGVPMGGTLTPADMEDQDEKPRFAVLASWDPGWTGRKGTRLQRVQIIKSWVDDEGQIHEKVIDYDDFDRGNAGHAKTRGANPKTCRPTRAGFKTLCAVWTDPEFESDQHAFYYARVLEQPSCRWNQYYCNAKQIQCDRPMGTCQGERRRHPHHGKGCYSLDDCGAGSICKLPESYTVWEYQQCCGDIVPALQQERAWTSPIWYEP